ncbi:PD40 domain-containing protein [Phototrophicus methaneseepsis]|uniref:PD40 domain-containing protein n=1 Tax=Phototrophicus methaneseepsis TaxID=2710758 RepID=A0A7S8E6E3_9CHLR|nr:PD40 domain-containing protein [Phototrophicus methaneseepsis]QPC81228.1 PD40 domain-containing protein [Phototrophicus methaneseepsis]
MTEDGTPVHRYQWPTWSTDGRLAYFCCDLEFSQTFETAAYIAPDSQNRGIAAFEGTAETIIYAAWSPTACDAENRCFDLAMLVSDFNNGGLYLELVHDVDATTTRQTVTQAAPLYYSWSADGTRILLHLNNQDLSIYSALQNDFDTSFEQSSSGTFQAPAWSPVDNRLLVGIPTEQGRGADLVVIEDGIILPLVQNIIGSVSFSWSPDGRYVAYRILDERGLNTLNVVEATSGALIAQSEIEGVVGFFWSPDSQKIAFVTPETPVDSINRPAQPMTIQHQFDAPQPAQDLVSLTWHILDTASGLSTPLNTFIPTSNFIYMLLYFDQFSQSHRIWSPDSQYLVYTELMLADSPVSLVQIRDVSDAAATPITVDNGTFAVWSYDE